MPDNDPNQRNRPLGDQIRQDIHDGINWRMQRRMDRRMRRHSGFGGLLVGTVLAGVGVLLLLQNLDVPFADDLWRYWPVIMIAVGVSRASTAWGTGGRIWGGVIAFAGTIFLLRNLDIIHGSVWNWFWPVILICVGLGMLARSLDSNSPWNWMGGSVGSAPSGNAPTGGAPGSGPIPSSSTSANWLTPVAIFSGVKRKVESQNFEGGEALAIFGGVVLDFRKAGTQRDEMVLEANALFGGIDIRVPENWNVAVRGTAIFGGYEDKSLSESNSAVKRPVLVVTGFVMFGGVSVKN